MKIAIPLELQKMNLLFERAGFEAYLVGGAVRDILMKKTPHDWDIATSALPQDVRRIFFRTIPTGIKHGTVTVLFMKRQIEVTTFRKEGFYGDGRRPDSVSFSASLKDDLSRRDFTMNALAANLKNGEVADFFSGASDIEKKVIRTVGSPRERFLEDGLRPIRAVRFASQLGFEIEEDTYFEIRDRDVLKKAARVSAERFRDEFLKILSSPAPSVGLRLMEESGLLKIFIPELLEGRGCSQSDFRGFREFDVLDHSLCACDAAPAGSAIVRLAALFHDVAKPRSKAAQDCGEAKENCRSFEKPNSLSEKAENSCDSCDEKKIAFCGMPCENVGAKKTMPKACVKNGEAAGLEKKACETCRKERAEILEAKSGEIFFCGPQKVSFCGHEILGEKITRKIMTRLKFSNAQIEKACLLVREHTFFCDLSMSCAEVRRFARRAGKENLSDLFLLRLSDLRGTKMPRSFCNEKIAGFDAKKKARKICAKNEDEVEAEKKARDAFCAFDSGEKKQKRFFPKACGASKKESELELFGRTFSSAPENFLKVEEEKLLQFQKRVEKILSQNVPLSAKELAISGNDLLEIGIPHGKKIGETLAALLEAVTEDPALNERERLLEKAKEFFFEATPHSKNERA